MRVHAEKIRERGETIAFVPTMGFLHEGHLSLMRTGREKADQLVVSIFVNPTQFGPNEDFESYPRDMQRDLALVEKEGAGTVFTPDAATLYPEGFQTRVDLAKLPDHLCGLSRPHFFGGVATIVTKLFNIVKPHIAVFGQKDYQQWRVIGQMVRDLNLDIKIIGAPTVRESDGLAMSSRNSYLTAPQRGSAGSLYQALTRSQVLVDDGIRDARRIIEQAEKLIAGHPETMVEYISICDTETLEPVQTIDKPVLMALAVKVGATRLIDNMVLTFK